MHAHQGGGNLVDTVAGEEFLAQALVLIVQCANAFANAFQQAGTILHGDGFQRGYRGPFGFHPGPLQHTLNAAAGGIGYDQHGGALGAGTAGAAGAVLQGFGVARHFNVNHEAKPGQIDAARGHIGGHAQPRAAVPQRLQRLVALGLAVLARQRDGGKTAFRQAGVQPANIVARGTEQQCGRRFVETQQIDHGGFDIGRRSGDALISDIGVGAGAASGGKAQRVFLIIAREFGNALGHGRRKHQGAAFGRRGIQDFFQILAEAHIEHFIGFIKHDDLAIIQQQPAAFEVIAQAARGADHDVRASRKRAPFHLLVHAAHARGDAPARRCIKPCQFLGHLQRQFARRCNHQRERTGRRWQRIGSAEQILGHGEAKGDGLARTGLRGNQQIPAARLFGDHGGLDGGEFFIAALRDGLGQRRGERFNCHGPPMAQLAAKGESASHENCKTCSCRACRVPAASSGDT